MKFTAFTNIALNIAQHLPQLFFRQFDAVQCSALVSSVKVLVAPITVFTSLCFFVLYAKFG